MPTETGGCWSSGMYTRRRMTSKMPQQAQRCSSGAFVFGSSWWVEAGSEIEAKAKSCKNAYSSRITDRWRSKEQAVVRLRGRTG